MASVSWHTWKTNRQFDFFADHDSPHSFGVGGPQRIEFRISDSACSVKHAPEATCPLTPPQACDLRLDTEVDVARRIYERIVVNQATGDETGGTSDADRKFSCSLLMHVYSTRLTIRQKGS
jgi:hypothetical protein